MMKKLKKNNGEALIETLVSLLIAVLAMGLVSTSVVAAANINEQNKQADRKYADELLEVETYATDAQTMSLKITFDSESDLVDKEIYIDVNVYGKDGTFASYRQEVDGR